MQPSFFMKRSTVLSLEKLELFRFIDNLKSEEVKSFHDYFIKLKKNDFWELLNESEKEDINTGIRDLEEGRSRPIAEVLRKYE